MMTVASVTALSHIHPMHALLSRHRNRGTDRERRARGASPLDEGAEMPDKPLHRPRRGVAERADGMTLDLVADLQQHIDLGDLSLAARHALEHAPHPARAFAAGGALAA